MPQWSPLCSAGRMWCGDSCSLYQPLSRLMLPSLTVQGWCSDGQCLSSNGAFSMEMAHCVGTSLHTWHYHLTMCGASAAMDSFGVAKVFCVQQWSHSTTLVNFELCALFSVIPFIIMPLVIFICRFLLCIGLFPLLGHGFIAFIYTYHTSCSPHFIPHPEFCELYFH